MKLTVPRTAAVALGTLVIMNGAATLFYDTFGAGVLDMSGGRNGADPRPDGYTPQQAYDMLTAYGPDGRRWHAILNLTGDVLLPAALLLFGLVALGSLARRARVGRWVLALPVLYVITDYAENVGIVTMLLRYPDRLDGVAALTNTLTMLKTTAVAACLVTAAVLGVLAWLRRGRPAESGDAG
ncbi:hypothetical protein Lfu02_20050 [Longispora fulva]|uniref:Uncharacterized protein n=1 Tax=Longispora fulva TaxID=619741 RepID=A0A8J7GN39_9ACTN|nr:hypothetical protein [Longispora fulva]MBG6139988.1 hypothetical protein [Longispora fulva]GIG57633.1 hypothetical protein Lfu02_20050 [Longispora fulva]